MNRILRQTQKIYSLRSLFSGHIAPLSTHRKNDAQASFFLCVDPTGLEHYMFSTPFAEIAQGFQVRATPSQPNKKTGKSRNLFVCGPDRT